MWLRRNEPELWQRSAHVVEALDYLTHVLTGEWVASALTATCKWNYDPLEGGFSDDLFATLGIPDLVTRLPGRIAPIGGIAGPLSSAAATGLGLLPSTPVAVGGIDAHMALAGTGATGRRLAVHDRWHLGGAPAAVDEGGVRPRHLGPIPGGVRAGNTGCSRGARSPPAPSSPGTGTSWPCHARTVDRGRERGRAGCGPACSPSTSSKATGRPTGTPPFAAGLLGLDLHHGPGHIYRAFAEGIAYGTRNATEAIERLGGSLVEVVVAGGIRHNPIWLQATADVLQRPIALPAVAEASVLGAAVVAAVASGTFESLDDAVRSMVRRERMIEPDSSLRDIYDEGFSRYRVATAALADMLHGLSTQMEPAPLREPGAGP